MPLHKVFFHLCCIIVLLTLVSSRPHDVIKPRAQKQETNTYDFTLKRVNLAPDGFTRLLSTINGQYPGPTIEVNKGDRIVMNFRNELGAPTCKEITRFDLQFVWRMFI